MKRVYIANGMSKHDDENRPWFYATAKKWRDAGWFVVSPAEINYSFEKPEAGTQAAYDKCMKIDLYAIHHMVDAIALGPDYLDSRGANFEVLTGLFFGLPFYDAQTMERIYVGAKYEITAKPKEFRQEGSLSPLSESPAISRFDEVYGDFQHVRERTEFTPVFMRTNTKGEDETRKLERGLHAAMGLCGEAGEVLELFKKDIFGYKYDGKKRLDREALVKELGDIQWYFDMMLDVYGITLEEVLATNAKKLRERYPERFDYEDKFRSQFHLLDELRLSQSETQPLPVIPTVAIMADGNGTLSHSGRRTVGGGKFTKDELLTLESAGINLLNESPSSWVPTTEDELRTAGILPS